MTQFIVQIRNLKCHVYDTCGGVMNLTAVCSISYCYDYISAISPDYMTLLS